MTNETMQGVRTGQDRKRMTTLHFRHAVSANKRQRALHRFDAKDESHENPHTCSSIWLAHAWMAGNRGTVPWPEVDISARYMARLASFGSTE